MEFFTSIYFFLLVMALVGVIALVVVFAIMTAAKNAKKYLDRDD